MERWSVDRAQTWYRQQPWPVGCNYIPRTAVNQLEMWQAATFDAATIAQELDWAAGLGLNTLRVYLHDLAWQVDPPGCCRRLDQLLTLAAARGLRTIPVLLDDCWNDHPAVGPQPTPQPGVHNSRWLQSPGRAGVNDPGVWPRLQAYVHGVVAAFATDARILLWDLYNEPGNSGQHEASLPLLVKAFEWARQARPVQPLSAGVWYDNAALNAFQLAASDLITLHNYGDPAALTAHLDSLRGHDRPLLCTEWLRRPHSQVETCLPLFHARDVGCCCWGLVAGRTQTIYPWGSPAGAAEPPVWFHDLLRPDGTPFAVAEAALFQRYATQQPPGR